MLVDVLLANDKVRMRDSYAVERKLNQIINADKNKLLVRLSFDILNTRLQLT